MKRITPELFDRYIRGRLPLKMMTLRNGAFGILFEGNRIFDSKDGMILDQAETVAELKRLGISQQTDAPRPISAPAPKRVDPDIIEVGGEPAALPGFVLDYESTGGLANGEAPKRSRQPIDAFKIEEGWTDMPGEGGEAAVFDASQPGVET